MALSGVNQGHVQPVWAEIPSRSANIGAGAVPRALSIGEFLSRAICSVNLNFGTIVPALNLLADPVNSRLPNQDTQEEMDIFSQAALIINAVLSYR